MNTDALPKKTIEKREEVIFKAFVDLEEYIREYKKALIPTATLVEHTLLTQGFMGTSTVSFPHHW